MSSYTDNRGFYYTYILTNKYRTTFYIGVTNDLQRRVYEHINKTNTSCFTAKYNVIELVYYEQSIYINNAITREKDLKGWKKDKKVALIKTINPYLETIFL